MNPSIPIWAAKPARRDNGDKIRDVILQNKP